MKCPWSVPIAVGASLGVFAACGSVASPEGRDPPAAAADPGARDGAMLEAAPSSDRPADAAAPHAAAQDAADTGAAADALLPAALVPGVPRCGPAPYHLVRFGVHDLTAVARDRPLKGAKITLKHCPGLAVVTDAEGAGRVYVTHGAETWIRFDASGFLPLLYGEVAVVASTPAPIVAAMLPEAIATTFLTGFKRDKPLVYVEVQLGRLSAPEACRDRAGAKVTVKGHAEAVVLYRNTGAIPTFSATEATTSEGVALVGGLSPTLGSVQVHVSKTGCRYVASYGDASSPELVPILRTPLQPGVLTYHTANPAR